MEVFELFQDMTDFQSTALMLWFLAACIVWIFAAFDLNRAHAERRESDKTGIEDEFPNF